MPRAALLTAIITLFLPAPGVAAPSFTPPRATLVAGGFDRPIAFVQDPSNPAVQVVVQQSGRIRSIVNGVVQATDYLDLSGAVLAQGEQGLLGLAFAPDYATSGRVFVYFINLSGNSVVARFTRHAADPLRADPATRFDFVWPGGNSYITQPFSNHNGGNLAFGPDGYLYVGLGDGGSGDDPYHNAQNPSSLLGKMLRLDVSVSESDAEGYDVPASNPFVGQPGVLGEIWAFGLRNPWRWSFDDPARGGTGALVIGDVGQNQWEEIDFEPAGAGGRNYGWRNREGAHAYISTLPPFSTPLTDPIFEYSHAEGKSVTGGFVYRGTALGPAFNGRYVFADFVFGRIWSLGLSIDPVSGAASVTDMYDHTDTLGVGTKSWSSFGVDAAGELYVLNYAGQLYRLDAGLGATPSGIELLQNRTFSHGTLNWLQFATPDPSYIVSNVTGGVFQYYRLASEGATNQAVVFQETGAPLGAGAPLLARFDLGNSSTVRKRISVLVLDGDFSDLSVCNFWLPPNTQPRTYQMRTHTTRAWTNASIYFYAATANAPGDGGFYQIDNVSLQYVPAQSAVRTDCVDPSTPAPPGGLDGANLLGNGDFGNALAPWGTFGTITSQLQSGVFEFIRPTAALPAGVVLQTTGQTMAAGQILTATFQLGNSSAVRKRVTPLLHDNDFTDLSACTFWLAPGQPLLTYTMRMYATKAWSNATISFYAATVGAEQWTRLDNVTYQRTPGSAIVGTECVEPSGGAPPPPTMVSAVASAAMAAPAPAAVARAGGADPQGDAPVWKATGHVRLDNAWVATPHGWEAEATVGGRSTLPWEEPVDLTPASSAVLRFQSRLESAASTAEVQVSVDSVNWTTVHDVLPSASGQEVEVDLSAFVGQVVYVQFVFDAVPPADAAVADAWRVENVEVQVS